MPMIKIKNWFYTNGDWLFLNFGKWFYLSLSNPFKTIKKIKKHFKPLQSYCSFGKEVYPIFYASKPSYIQIITRDVSWKDKYDTPRFEDYPFIWFSFLGYNIIIYWDLPEHQRNETEDYWEQALWYLYYCDGDINKAKETWPWKNLENDSTWNNKFLIK